MTIHDFFTKWKKSILKARFTVWFQLFDVLEKAKLWSQLPGVSGGRRDEQADEQAVSLGNETTQWFPPIELTGNYIK